MSNEEQLERICKAYEKKLIELMGISKFMAYSAKIAIEMLKDDFLENSDAITGSDEDYQKRMGNIQPHHVEAHCMPAGNCFECKHAIAINEKFLVCDLINESSHKCKFESRKKEDDDGD